MDVSLEDDLAFVASCVSGMASAYLFVILRRLPVHRRRTLLARQLQHLAAADLFFAITEISIAVVDFTEILQNKHDGNVVHHVYSKVSFTLNEVGYLASAAFQCHLAVAFAASILKRPHTLGALSRSLPFVWFLVIVLSFPSLFLLEIGWGSKKQNWPVVGSLLVNFTTCVACYVVCSCQVRTAGVPVQRLVWLRARSYLLVFCVSGLSFLVYNVKFGFTGKTTTADTVPGAVANALFDLTGLLNFIVYWLLNRQAKKLMVADYQEHEFSYHVTFHGTDSVRQVSADSSRAISRPAPDPIEVSMPSTSYWVDMFPEDKRDAPSCPLCAQAMQLSESVRGQGAVSWSCCYCHSGPASFDVSQRWLCGQCCFDVCLSCGGTTGTAVAPPVISGISLIGGSRHPSDSGRKTEVISYGGDAY